MISVYYRHCYYSKIQELPGRGRPSWYNKEKVFQNFKSTIDKEIVNYKIIYDEFHGSIENTFLKDEQNVHKINCGGEAKSFLETLKFLQNQNHDPNDIIYLLEDDYIHHYQWVKTLLEGFSLPASYVTLYDHKDKYTSYYYNFNTKVTFTKSCHWMITPSTTNTFAAKYSTLIDDLEIHQKYSTNVEPSVDHQKFLDLSKKGKILISSIPGYSTHCSDKFLSPCVDWEKYL